MSSGWGKKENCVIPISEEGRVKHQMQRKRALSKRESNEKYIVGRRANSPLRKGGVTVNFPKRWPLIE